MTNGLKRNKRTFYYCPYQGEQPIYDEWLNQTGEVRVVYGESVAVQANISPASGVAQTEMFGNLESYDKVISPLPVDFPLTENDVLFVDKEPEYNEDGDPKYDYKVRRIARSLNYTAVAITKVEVQ